MLVSRRQVLGSGAAAAIVAATALSSDSAQADEAVPSPVGAAAIPSWAVVALSRMGYGRWPCEIAYIPLGITGSAGVRVIVPKAGKK